VVYALLLSGAKRHACFASVAVRRVCDCDDDEKGSAAAGAFSDFILRARTAKDEWPAPQNLHALERVYVVHSMSARHAGPKSTTRHPLPQRWMDFVEGSEKSRVFHISGNSL
jgi:hypothetical protein